MLRLCHIARERTLVPWFFLLLLVLLPSCSSKDTNIRPTVQIVSSSFEPVKPDAPYCRIDYNCPTSEIRSPRIYVFKSERRLLLVQDDTLVRDFRIGLGPHPSGDKFMRGDGRTPEGEFYVCVKNPDSKFYKSLGLSYPAPKHAEQAYLLGAISREEYFSITDACRTRCIPPWNTVLGGAIFIHGGGAHEDWTEGCVALSNSAMDELFEIVPVGAPVQILP